MRHFILTFLISILSIQLMAQAPDAFQYQAVLRDSDGNIRSNETVELSIAILQNSTNGTEVYSETHNTTTNDYGLINLLLGEGTTSDDFSAIDWSAGDYFVEIQVDDTVMGTTQLLSVPYAKYSAMAGSAESAIAVSNETQNLSDVLDKGNSAGNNTIEQLADPQNEYDAVNKAYVDQLMKRIEMLETVAGVDTVTDSEGNVYNTVRIGNQVWMAEGLRATEYSDGSEITGIYWFGSDYNNDGDINAEDSTFYVEHYGFLYTTAAAMNGASSSNTNPSGVQGACPTGWHLPSRLELEVLKDTLGGYGLAGGKLKDTNTDFWDSPNAGATNQTGFTARGTGNYSSTGHFYQINYIGYFMTATEAGATDQYVFRIYSDDDNLSLYPFDKNGGATIRCVKNQ